MEPVDKPNLLQHWWKDIILIVLAVISIGLLYTQMTVDLSVEQTRVLIYADGIIAFTFWLDFAVSYIRARDRSQFARRRWWELPAAIPLGIEYLGVLRSFQLLRLVRLFHLARIIRGAIKFSKVFDNVQSFTEEVKLMYVLNILGGVVISGALGFHYFEADSNPEVHGFLDSIWWSLSSVAGLGAGNIYPTTDAGKFVGMILVIVGMGVVSAFAGLIASFLVRHRHEEEE